LKILLTGQSGQIGGELALSLQGVGEVIYFPRTVMDLSDLDQVRDVIRAVRPDLIVNPAAYTAVVQAESEPSLAALINGEAPGVMAEEAQRLGAAIIHYSTDYVFDGAQAKPYDETASTNPLNVYGQSKLAGELAIARHCEAHWILRTSWVYDTRGSNFLKTVIRMAHEQSRFSMTADQFGAPTWARTVSRVTREILSGDSSNAVPASSALSRIRASSGIYHMTAGGAASWHEYASFIVDHLRARGVPTKISGSAAIKPVPTAPGLPNRPKNSRLALDKLENTFKLRMPHWQSDVRRCLDEIIDRATLPGAEPDLRNDFQQ
jgi:dTDP-4-dehydrorhamnose reductase